MTRLVLAELRRLRSRRLTWIALVVLLLAVAALQLAVYESVKPLTPTEITDARVQYEQAKQEYDQHPEREKAAQQECIELGEPPETCSTEPRPEYFLYREPVAFGEIAPFVVTTAVYFTGFALALVAASFIGAEFSTGALANWLTFLPDRRRVFTAKVLAVLVAAAAAAAGTLALAVGLGIGVTRLSGAVVTGAEMEKVWLLGARGVALAAIFALLGFAVALLTRHTVGAIGALVGYFLVSSVLTFLVELIRGLAWLKALLPQQMVSAFLNHGTDYQRSAALGGESPQGALPMLRITFGESVLYWSVLLGAMLALCFVVFRRRDVN